MTRHTETPTTVKKAAKGKAFFIAQLPDGVIFTRETRREYTHGVFSYNDGSTKHYKKGWYEAGFCGRRELADKLAAKERPYSELGFTKTLVIAVVKSDVFPLPAAPEPEPLKPAAPAPELPSPIKATPGYHFTVATAPDGTQLKVEGDAPYKFAILQKYKGDPIWPDGWRVNFYISESYAQASYRGVVRNQARPGSHVESVCIVPAVKSDVFPLPGTPAPAPDAEHSAVESGMDDQTLTVAVLLDYAGFSGLWAKNKGGGFWLKGFGYFSLNEAESFAHTVFIRRAAHAAGNWPRNV